MNVQNIIAQPIHTEQPINQPQLNQPQQNANAAGTWLGRSIIVITVVSVVGLAVLVIVELFMILKESISNLIWRPDPLEITQDVEQKFAPSFVNKVKTFASDDYLRYFKRLSICMEDEKEILSTLESRFEMSHDDLQEVFMGAHIRLDDGGELYKEWVAKIEQKNARMSSHPADNIQYGVRGPLVKELLFSRTTEDGKTYTWLQLENNPVTVGSVIRHFLDYIKYKWSGRNQGPDGTSVATHHNPLILKLKSE